MQLLLRLLSSFLRVTLPDALVEDVCRCFQLVESVGGPVGCYVSPLDWSRLLTGYDYGLRLIISHGLVIRWRITCTIVTHS